MLPSLLYALHVLGAVLWVGGMAFAVLALRPALATLDPPARLALLADAQGRFIRQVWHVMPIVLLTGWALLFGWYGGFAGAGWHVHLMHATALAMTAIFLVLAFGPWRAFRAAQASGDLAAAAAHAAAVRRLVVVNLALGALTVGVASYGRFGG